MTPLEFDKMLEAVSEFYWEEEPKNRLFNTFKFALAKLENSFYLWAIKHEDFKNIEGLEKEKIVYEAMEDEVNELSKDFI